MRLDFAVLGLLRSSRRMGWPSRSPAGRRLDPAKSHLDPEQTARKRPGHPASQAATPSLSTATKWICSASYSSSARGAATSTTAMPANPPPC
jgi:hypothetical protein